MADDNATGAVLILAPVGRDAAAISSLIERTASRPVICQTSTQLVNALQHDVDAVVVSEEALYGDSVSIVGELVDLQPPWSDLPFIVLSTKNDASKFLTFRRGLVRRLRNVVFLERPLQAIALQASVLSAVRARKRQYEARAYLNSQRSFASKLEQLVADRTLELQDTNKRLRDEIITRERAQAALLQAQKIEALGQLVGGVAHDFNNLLMAVIGNLDLLAKGMGENPRLRRFLGGAMEGARRGATLTQRLLAFARKQELQAKATDLPGLVQDIRDLIERSVGPMIRVCIEVDDAVPAVTVDANQLEMALLNLAVNARDAMPNGGVLTIGVGCDEVLPHETQVPRTGRYVVLSMQDTGEGMDKETMAKAVEPFFSTKAVGKGTGLGLSMVSGLAEQSGGALRLESTPGQGTNAAIWLPIAVEAVAARKQHHVATPTTAQARILLVDDDPLIAGSTVSMLEDLGHQVTEAHSAAEALQLLKGGLATDLLITDHAMPGMTGMELAGEVRHRHPDLPILLATGFAEPTGGKAIDLPRLAKPYTQDQLARVIALLLPNDKG
jgi:signal transduction histidine kinase